MDQINKNQEKLTKDRRQEQLAQHKKILNELLDRQNELLNQPITQWTKYYLLATAIVLGVIILCSGSAIGVHYRFR